MARKEFIGRAQELGLIDRLWQSGKAELIVLYGRRRVGKTRLLTHWINRHEREGLYWMAEPTSAVDQLRSFSQAVMNYMEPEEPAPLDFTYANWEQALRQLSYAAKEKRVAIFIDEITYLMDINPAIVGTFQKVWDHRLSKSNIVLALSGSQMGTMQKQVLAYNAPLYGRPTAQIKLPPLPFGVTKRYFPNYTPEERVAVYAIWGGVPAYWERINPDLNFIENLQLLLEPSNAWMLDESRLLLQDFLTDLYNYIGIMRAMAHGAHTLKEIGDRNGLSSTHMSSYLKVLRETNFVERVVPVTQRDIKSRLGRYQVTDPYLRFYYRFLAAYHSKLALGQQKQVIKSVQEDLPTYIQAYTWKELCQEWLARASDFEEVPIPLDYVGAEWKRSFYIDVMGISEEKRTLALGSCHWGEMPNPVGIIKELIQITSSVIPKNEPWTVYYLGFSSGTWTPEAQAQADTLIRDAAANSRSKWEFAGVQLVSLEDLDADLTRWSNGR
jgi:hypothetical protein